MTSFFTNPWMLTALAAVALPWLIEWLFRRRKRQVELPTLRYLLRNKEQEQIKRQDRILLLLRTLAVFFLVLIVARPLLQQRWLNAGQKRNVLILLDATSSMNQQIGVTTAFGLAQKKAANLVRGLPKETQVTVATLSDTVESLLSAEQDPLTIAGRIEALRSPCGSAPMSSAMSWAKETAAKISSSANAQTELYVFSDFQQYTWKRPGIEAAKDAQSFRDTASACETFLVDTGGTPAFNFLVTDLRPAEYLITTGMPAKFSATIESRGHAPESTRAKVTFLIDGIKKDVREVTPGEKPLIIEFEHRFQKPGEYIVEALLEGDDHPIDNRRLYLCSVLDDAKILVLDESPEKTESLFLARAIAPPNRPGADKVSQFAVKTITPAQLAYENLDDYSALILVATSALTTNVAARIERYVAEGGSAWFFLGPQANAYDYNKLLYKEGKGLLPCRLATEKTDNSEAPAHVDFSGSAAHPVLFNLSESSASTAAQVTRFRALELNPASAQVLLSLSNGAPAIVEQPFARGGVLLFNLTAGPAWTHLPALPEFPILIQSLLTHSIGNPDARVNLNGGDRFESPVFISSQHLLLKCPDGRKERLTPQLSGPENWRVTFDRTNQPGLYEFADAQQEVLPRHRFVVNPRTEEGDLARFTEREFRDFAGGVNFNWSGPGEPIEEFAAKLHSVTELSPWILAALVALLAAESFLAAKFGRRRSAEKERAK